MRRIKGVAHGSNTKYCVSIWRNPASSSRRRVWPARNSAAPRHFVLFDRDSFARMAENQGLHVKSFASARGAPFWTVSVLNELRTLGLVKISRERPSIYHPLAPLFQGLFGGLDILRGPLLACHRCFLCLSAPSAARHADRAARACPAHGTPQTAKVRRDIVRSWRRS